MNNINTLAQNNPAEQQNHNLNSAAANQANTAADTNHSQTGHNTQLTTEIPPKKSN